MALFEAAASGNRERVQELLDSGVDVNAASSDGATALIWAIE